MKWGVWISNGSLREFNGEVERGIGGKRMFGKWIE